MNLDKDKYLKSFDSGGVTYRYYDIQALADDQGVDISRLPYTIRVLLESALRQFNGDKVTEKHIADLLNWQDTQAKEEYPFKPERVILQDFTGVPAIVDLASMRQAMAELNLDPDDINPDIPVDLVIDHSVQVDYFGSQDAAAKNQAVEFERNDERYKFIKWAQTAFDNFKVVPNNTGIIHQVNIEYLADVVSAKSNDQGQILAYPDSCFGTDSHTTMVNGIGVLGWGVGGIEAEAAMLGQFSYNPLPEVVGVELTGQLKPTVNATDLALAVTKLLRDHQVVGKFVEFFGEGLEHLSSADRTTVANMAPEYGATCGFFPTDQETIDYLELTNRQADHRQLVADYSQANALWYEGADNIDYSTRLSLDMSTIQTSISGPKRPQDKMSLTEVKDNFIKSLTHESGNHGFGLDPSHVDKVVTLDFEGKEIELRHGSLIIAAITSCTNTSNPEVMMAAGLLAKHAVEKGLKVPSYVKTSLAPGSKTVTEYLDQAGLLPYLQDLGFNVVGYGCTTCIGNSGPIHADLSQAINDHDLISASVLSGNRNFEGRINPDSRANFLASPPLVIAFALAGQIDIDLTSQPMGHNDQGEAIYLKDIWPSDEEVNDYIERYVSRDIYETNYATLYEDNKEWQELEVSEEAVYEWDPASTYVQNPPYFDGMSASIDPLENLDQLRVLGLFGDSVTTDHISPAGAIAPSSPAGLYLQSHGVDFANFNSYGSRRGNHQVMMRGTLANIRIQNQLADGKVGGYTKYWPTEEMMPIYDAAMKYKEDGQGLIIIAGDDYGMGSSRDWAAKGSLLLNVEAVLVKSFERIHRSNLVMMGVLPLEFLNGQDAKSLGLRGDEVFSIPVSDDIGIHEEVTVIAERPSDRTTIEFKALVRLDSQADIEYYKHGGILPYVIRQKAIAD